MLVTDAANRVSGSQLEIVGIKMTAVEEHEITAAASIASDALVLLDCFDGQVGEVVYGIAEEFAKERGKGQAVEITASDVRKAGEIVIAGLQKMVEMGRLPSGFVPQLDGMRDCFLCKDR